MLTRRFDKLFLPFVQWASLFHPHSSRLDHLPLPMRDDINEHSALTSINRLRAMRPLTSGQRTDRLGYNVPSFGRRRGGQHADDTTGISFSARRDGDKLASVSASASTLAISSTPLPIQRTRWTERCRRRWRASTPYPRRVKRYFVSVASACPICVVGEINSGIACLDIF